MTKEEMFDALMEHARLNVGIIFKDLDGNVLAMNNMRGADREQMVGKNDMEADAKHGPQWREHDKLVAKANKTMSFREEWETEEAVHIVNATKFPIRNKAGEVIGTGVMGKIVE
jgi:hypothetical protein